MAKDRNGTLPEDASGGGSPAASSRSDRHSKSKRKKEGTADDDSTDSGDHRKRRLRSRSSRSERDSRKRRRRDSSDESDDSDSDSSSESDSDESDSGTSDSDARRRQRRRDRESEKERRRRKEKERERERRRRKEKEERRRKKEKKKKKKEKGVKGAVTNSWGKYGIIRETDMWNKRPEFTAWLAEVKQMNLETLGNKEEKQLFKDFMEDHNTATFPSKKYYDLDTYHHRQLEKEMKKGSNKVKQIERMVFNDEEQRRQELLKEREKHKEEQVETLKRSMQSGMAQAMKEQSRLREEMAYQYKLGNFEAAAAIQRRLDPDAAP